MAGEHVERELAHAQELIRSLQAELADTNRGLVALTLELEQRVDARTAELREAHQELQRTNSELLQLTLDLEARVENRTEEVRKLNLDLERRVRERTTQLEVANKELEAFTYSVSHDLRAPLRHINGYSTMLLDDYAPTLPSDAQRMLNTIKQRAGYMGELIDDLLRLSRLGRQPLAMRRIDIAGLVREVVEELRKEQGDRRLEMRIGDLHDALGDPTLLKQVFVNLLSNAFKFTRHKEHALVEVDCRPQATGNTYLVRDNGAGFDMRYADKLFAVFQRLHRDEQFEGTGVGLSIVQRIVERHGGRTWAEAEVDKGATFYFSLPA